MNSSSSRWRRWWPTPESLKGNRWLGWLGPSLYHPRLWRITRRGLALGMAIGIFFGLLIPIAQIPFSAALAVALRANVPAAMASTLVTNPVTFAPVYYLAYQTGQEVLAVVDAAGFAADSETSASNVRPLAPALPAGSQATGSPEEMAVKEPNWITDLTGVGRPLVVGLALFAVLGGLIVYAVASVAWVFHVRLKRKRRLRRTVAVTPPSDRTFP